eukprot:INCI5322.5.p1 GENE.INCI5322.5~~INCI5322.5.p1  ORF type:complete len:428 (+),score=78.65 INCI5322.5:124-1407(+)
MPGPSASAALATPSNTTDDAPALRVLRKELQLLETILRQNKNQHRSAKFYQKFVEIRRTLAKYVESRDRKRRKSSGRSSRLDDTGDGSSASRGAEAAQLAKSAEELKMCCRVVAATVANSRHAVALLQQTYFMPFALTVLSIAARVHTVCTYCLARHVQALNSQHAACIAARGDQIGSGWSEANINTLIAVANSLLASPTQGVAQSGKPDSLGSSTTKSKPGKKRGRKGGGGKAHDDFGEVLSREVIEEYQDDEEPLLQTKVRGRMQNATDHERDSSTESDNDGDADVDVKTTISITANGHPENEPELLSDGRGAATSVVQDNDVLSWLQVSSPKRKKKKKHVKAKKEGKPLKRKQLRNPADLESGHSSLSSDNGVAKRKKSTKKKKKRKEKRKDEHDTLSAVGQHVGKQSGDALQDLMNSIFSPNP